MAGNTDDEDRQLTFLSDYKMSRETARIIRFATEIVESPPEKPDFLHTVLCQVGLPRRATPELKFERRNGLASLLVEAGSLYSGQKWQQQPLPYGPKPRLALVHISTEAVRTKSRIIDSGRSLHEFMRRLGIGTNGREYKNFRQQMRALSACRMSLGYGNTTIDAKPIEKFSTWNALEDANSLDDGVIELTTKFYESLIESAVPLDPRALACLQGSSLALDIYTWLSHRLHRVSRMTGDRVTWSNLADQFGQEYSEIKDFKKTFQKALVSVRAVYPDARLEEMRGGYILLPSKPPVPAKPSIGFPTKTTLLGGPGQSRGDS
jgi:Plasmid encoded RepA protein